MRRHRMNNRSDVSAAWHSFAIPTVLYRVFMVWPMLLLPSLGAAQDADPFDLIASYEDQFTDGVIAEYDYPKTEEPNSRRAPMDLSVTYKASGAKRLRRQIYTPYTDAGAEHRGKTVTDIADGNKTITYLEIEGGSSQLLIRPLGSSRERTQFPLYYLAPFSSEEGQESRPEVIDSSASGFTVLWTGKLGARARTDMDPDAIIRETTIRYEILGSIARPRQYTVRAVKAERPDELTVVLERTYRYDVSTPEGVRVPLIVDTSMPAHDFEQQIRFTRLDFGVSIPAGDFELQISDKTFVNDEIAGKRYKYGERAELADPPQGAPVREARARPGSIPIGAEPMMRRSDAEGQIARYLAASLTRLGQEAPSFEVETLAGVTISSDDLRGKVVLVHFYATWCGWCFLVEPRLTEKVWRRFKDNPNFVMVAVSRAEPPEVVRRHRDQRGLAFPVAADPDGSIYAKFARDAIPRDYVIDAKGKVIYQWGEQDRPVVEEVFRSGRERASTGEMFDLKYEMIAEIIGAEIEKIEAASGQ